LFLNYARLQGGMAKVNKAARGKHRWVGFHLLEPDISREECEEILTNTLPIGTWRLFDLKNNVAVSKAIIKIPLEKYVSSLILMNDNELLETQTSSGKIRLVRERLGIK
jgi:hypothetical protein